MQLKICSLTPEGRCNCVFTLPDNDTDTDTKADKLQQYSMALLSRCSVNISTQFYTTHFYRCLCRCRAV